MRELSAHEMNAVAGGFSIGSCSVGASYSSSRDGHGGSSTSMSVHASCGLNALTEAARGLIPESRASIRRYREEVPFIPDEKAILEQDAEKVERTLTKFATTPEG
ncbi:hypothetical protein [Pantoea sp. GD03673]|uniref:hypothetical protein n=1 Tax=Pantoea sp. GD03673 TaxID=2975364 RepID=UPI00244B1018|nr:hypothetical protein [Pantoea sp. GD03673]MDH2067766.1 hypothetical protein [Pantoea sp. GD03673]